MTEKPKRRWFRFRLSTVLILTAIVAWAMACRPYVTVWLYEPVPMPLPGKPLPEAYAYSKSDAGVESLYIPHQGPNPRLIAPAVALAVFLAWKAAWAAGERRRTVQRRSYDH
jgi:hypothetical protein